MSHVAEACARLIPDVYEAALGRHSVMQVLRDFARICGAEPAAISTVLASGRKAIALGVDVDAALIESYNAEFHRLDTVVPQAGARQVAFIPGTSAAAAIYPGYERSDLYNAWARPHGAHQIAFATGDVPGGAKASLLLVAEASDRRFGRAGQMAALGLVAPHVFQMLRLADGLRAVRSAEASFLAMIEAAAPGVLLLDEAARVVHVTARARDILDRGDGLRLTARGLCAAAPAVQRRIEAMIAGVLGRGALAAGGAVIVPRPSGSAPYLLQAVPLPRRREEEEIRALLGPEQGRAALLTLADPARAPRLDPQTLRQAFGLTPAEAGVALGILDGAEPRRIAAETGVGIATVRSHLLRVFEKTGVHRQVDLSRLLGGLAR